MSFSFRHFNHDHSPLQIIGTKLLVESRNKVPPCPQQKAPKTSKNNTSSGTNWLVSCPIHLITWLAMFATQFAQITNEESSGAQDTICYHPRCTTSLGPSPSPVPEKRIDTTWPAWQLGRLTQLGALTYPLRKVVLSPWFFRTSRLVGDVRTSRKMMNQISTSEMVGNHQTSILNQLFGVTGYLYFDNLDR